MCLTFSIIPRTAGVSRSTEERPRRASPSPLSVARCRSVQPMKLPSIVTVIIFSAVATVLLPQVPHGLAAHRGDLVGQIHLPEGVHGGFDHVVGVVGANTFGKNVLDSGQFDDRTNRAAGNDTGTGPGRLEPDAAFLTIARTSFLVRKKRIRIKIFIFGAI